jgi:hypothetical protein
VFIENARLLSIFDPPPTLRTHGFELITGNSELEAWADENAQRSENGETIFKARDAASVPVQELVKIGVAAVRALDADRVHGLDFNGRMGSIIPRTTGPSATAPPPYTNTVHR